MTKTALVFPGQGSQFVGMGKELFQASDSTKTLFKKASDICNIDFEDVCFNGPLEKLTETQITQPAIFLVSAALYLEYRKYYAEPMFVAGHSLGEISAYFAADVLSFEDALRLINVRASAMAESCAPGTTAMAAVMKASEDIIEAAVSKATPQPVVVANYNNPSQIVISGTKDGVEAASVLLSEQGARVIPLNVSGAFHSPLMTLASEELTKCSNNLTFKNAAIPIVLNRTAEPENDAEVLRQNLALQVVSSVNWTRSVTWLAQRIDQYIECGPGKVLTGLIKKTVQDKHIRQFSTPEELSALSQ